MDNRNGHGKNTHGIYKITDEKMVERVLEMTRVRREINLLEKKYEYFGNLVSYKSTFERIDGQNTYHLGYMGVNIEKSCYVTRDTHEGPLLEPEYAKLADQARRIVKKIERLTNQRKKDNLVLWEDLEKMFNLDGRVNWGICSKDMTVTREEKDDGFADFLKDLLS